jgi:hypothetical protein
MVPKNPGTSINTIPKITPDNVPNMPGRFLLPKGLSIPMKPSVIKIAPIACSAAAYVAGHFSL